ncbi:hypothetical protein C2W59_03754 [Bacillus pumilus]|nr:hypothetical protein C2W59_03754 [Bacillus pumilus]
MFSLFFDILKKSKDSKYVGAKNNKLNEKGCSAHGTSFSSFTRLAFVASCENGY